MGRRRWTLCGHWVQAKQRPQAFIISVGYIAGRVAVIIGCRYVRATVQQQPDGFNSRRLMPRLAPLRRQMQRRISRLVRRVDVRPAVHQQSDSVGGGRSKERGHRPVQGCLQRMVGSAGVSAMFQQQDYGGGGACLRSPVQGGYPEIVPCCRVRTFGQQQFSGIRTLIP